MYEKMQQSENDNDVEPAARHKSQFKKLFEQARDAVPFKFPFKKRRTETEQSDAINLSDFAVPPNDIEQYAPQPGHSKESAIEEPDRSEVYCEVATECVEGVNYNQRHGSGFSSWWTTNRKVVTNRLRIGRFATQNSEASNDPEPEPEPEPVPVPVPIPTFVLAKPLEETNETKPIEDISRPEDTWYDKIRSLRFPGQVPTEPHMKSTGESTIKPDDVSEAETPLPQMFFRYATCVFTGGTKKT